MRTSMPLAQQLDTIQIQISGLPLIATSMHELRDDVRQLRQDMRMLRAAVNDMARINITGGEVEALHADLDRLAVEQADIKTRLALLEQRKGP